MEPAERLVSWRRGALVTALLAMMALFAVVPVGASAAPPTLWTRCDGGAGDVSCYVPRGIATDPDNGDVYIADQANSRIVEYDVWGRFLRTWGWGVKDGAAKLEVCTEAAACQAGIGGSGAGQFSGGAKGMATDSKGNVYAVDIYNHRVQKFDSEGHFILTFGGEVNKTKSEEVGSTEAQRNLCTAASGDVCQKGTLGSGKGQFAELQFGEQAIGSFIATGPGDKVFVGDRERIQVFEPTGAYEEDLPDPEGLLAGVAVSSLAVDPDGNLFVALQAPLYNTSPNPNVLKLSPGGKALCTAEVKDPRAVASDAGGNLYVIDGTTVTGPTLNVRKFGSGCVESADPSFPFGPELVDSTGLAIGSACFTGDPGLYVSNTGPLFSVGSPASLHAYNAPDKVGGGCPSPPPVAPEIDSEYTVSAGSDGAVVRGQINPHFWADTSYWVQYGTAACLAGGWEAPCVKEQPGAPGSKLGAGVTDAAVTTAGVFLAGLEADTTYRYRFAAQSGGGGPAFGADASFHTFAVPSLPSADCPNQAFRGGPSAALVDCRAYEMVSPIDKGGADILSFQTTTGEPTALNQSAVSGDKLSYSSFQAFGDAQSKPYTSQYIASRDPGAGWSTHGISPPQGVKIGGSLAGQDGEFKAFSADLCTGWLRNFASTAPPLAPGAKERANNLYRRSNCATPTTYETLNPGGGELQGLSADGSDAIFRVFEGGGKVQLFEHFKAGEEPRPVCIRPNETTVKSCSAGTANGEGGANNVSHAISADGSRIFWTDEGSRPGRIYVRIGGETTVPVSESVTTKEARFWTAAAGGSKAIFTVAQGPLAGNLYEFDVDAESVNLIAAKVIGMLGASEDASRIYFASSEVLTGEAPNSEGAKAQVGKPNLYLYRAGDEGEGGSFAFIATLSSADTVLKGSNPGSLNVEPVGHAARVSPGGAAAAFISRAPLTGYDNTDVSSGEADLEVFRYDAASGKLSCVSCNPSGARPVGRHITEFPKNYWVAAQIPGAETQLYASRTLSDDGKRLFFDSFDPLVLADTNGKEDVYEWEAPGSGDCSAAAPAFSPSANGCVSLISSGENLLDSEFVDASPDGRDAFINTGSSLQPFDPGLLDIYDARAGGGIPLPPAPQPACEGEACQSPPAAPNDPTPASSSFEGKGNLAPRRHKHKHKRAHRKHRRAQHNHGRAAR